MRTADGNGAPRPDVGWRLDAVSWGVLLLASVLIIVQFALPPLVGYADNGDFVRVIGPLGLVHDNDPAAWEYWYHVDPFYEYGAPGRVDLWSSEMLLTGLAIRLGRTLAPDAPFDLRLVGAVHAAFYLAGLYLVLTALQTFPRRVRWTAAVCLLLVAADAACVVYLNSFYAEAASLVFLTVCLGLLLRSARARYNSVARTVLLFASIILFAGSKAQNHWLALPLLAAALLLQVAKPRPRLMRLKAVLTAVALVVIVALFVQIPVSYRAPVKWDTLFASILVVSPDPAADLAVFGLPAELVQYRGRNAWGQGQPLYETAERFTLGDLGRFYLRHPGRLLAVAEACAAQAFTWRDPRLGNRTAASGLPAGAQAPSLTGWSTFEGHLFPRSLWFLVGFLAACAAGAVLAWRGAPRDPAARNTAVVFGAATVMTALAFATAVVTEGLHDTVKHLFIFQVLFDVCVIAAVARGAGWMFGQFPAGWWKAAGAVGRDDRRQN